MKKTILALTVISTVALILSAAALLETYNIISQNQPHPTAPISTQQPTVTSKPTTPPQQTNAFNPTLAADPLFDSGLLQPVSIPANIASNETSLSYNDVQILPGNSYNYLETAPNGTVILSSNSINNRLINGVYTFQFSVTLTNPSTSTNSSSPYDIQFAVTKIDATTISAQDVTLTVIVPESNPIGAMFGEIPNYYYFNLTASANANELTYLCNPRVTDNLQTTGGSIITSGFDQTLEMTISFAATGTYNLSVKLVPT